MRKDLKDFLVRLSKLLKKYDAHFLFDGELEIVVNPDEPITTKRNWDMIEDYLDEETIRELLQ